MKPGLGRLLCVLAGVAALSLVGFYAIRSSRTADKTLALKIGSPLPAWKPGPGWASAIPPERHAGEAIRIPIYPPWTEKAGRALFAPSEVEFVDPFAGKLYKPNLSFSVEFPEHPDGRIQFVVNSRSMREDDEPRAKKPALRILVAGDSHTEGVCKNSESFANRTEAALRERARVESRERGQSFDPTEIEVLNAGKGYHSFYNYLGVLEHHLDLEPDVFVVTVYGGNDFEEVLSVWHYYYNQGQRPAGSKLYGEQLQAALSVKLNAPSQSLGSVKYFDAYPEQKKIAVDAGTEVFVQMQALCRERGIRLIAQYLPARTEIEPENPDLELPRLLEALGLQPAALASTDEMADRLLANLAGLGIESIDLRPALKAAGRSMYWNEDWELNVAGHAVVAEQLTRALSARR